MVNLRVELNHRNRLCNPHNLHHKPESPQNEGKIWYKIQNQK